MCINYEILQKNGLAKDRIPHFKVLHYRCFCSLPSFAIYFPLQGKKSCLRIKNWKLGCIGKDYGNVIEFPSHNFGVWPQPFGIRFFHNLLVNDGLEALFGLGVLAQCLATHPPHKLHHHPSLLPLLRPFPLPPSLPFTVRVVENGPDQVRGFLQNGETIPKVQKFLWKNAILG